jgi:hypothetical protein
MSIKRHRDTDLATAVTSHEGRICYAELTAAPVIIAAEELIAAPELTAAPEELIAAPEPHSHTEELIAAPEELIAAPELNSHTQKNLSSSIRTHSCTRAHSTRT